jgi:hypothetical protein
MGGSQPCNAQQMAACMAAVISHCPSQGFPSSCPAASIKPCPGRIHGHVGGLLNDVKTFKVYPHGMGRIGDAAAGEGISRQQVAELIVPARSRYSQQRDERGANGTGQESKRDHWRKTRLRGENQEKQGEKASLPGCYDGESLGLLCRVSTNTVESKRNRECI